MAARQPCPGCQRHPWGTAGTGCVGNPGSSQPAVGVLLHAGDPPQALSVGTMEQIGPERCLAPAGAFFLGLQTLCGQTALGLVHHPPACRSQDREKAMTTMASATQDGGCPLGTCLLCVSWPACDLPWQDLSLKCLFAPEGVCCLEVIWMLQCLGNEKVRVGRDSLHIRTNR